MIPLKLFHIAKNWLQIDILCPDTDYFKIETVFSLKPDVVCRNIWYYANSSLARSLTKIRQSWICWYNHIPWNSCDGMNRDLIFYIDLYTGFHPFFYLLHNSLFCPVFLEIQLKGIKGNTKEIQWKYNWDIKGSILSVCSTPQLGITQRIKGTVWKKYFFISQFLIPQRNQITANLKI